MEPTSFDRPGAWFNTTDAKIVADEDVFADTIGIGRRLSRIVIRVLTVVSFLGSGAAGVWLALHGHRKEAAIGLGLAIAMPIVWSVVAFWPSTLIAAPIMGRYRCTRPTTVVVRSLLAAGWQYCVIATWTLGVFVLFARYMYPGVILPMTALAYGAVLGPLSFMAGRDPGIDSAPVLALAYTLVVFATLVVCYSLDATIVASAVCLGVLAALAAGIQTTISARAAMRQRRDSFDAQAGEPGSVGRSLHQSISRAA